MDTKGETSSSEPVVLIAGRDTLQREVGLHLAVATMKKGEKARLQVSAEYGYGAQGSFSFPTVPPNARLEYDIELIDWDPVNENKEIKHMTYEERLEAAQRRRLEGNDLHASGDFAGALAKYRMASSFLDEDLLIQLEGIHLDQANAVRMPLLLNSAACYIKLSNYGSAIASASEALMIDEKNPKALYRRGMAKHGLGQTEQAYSDLKCALSLSPGDAAIIKELAAVNKSLKEEMRAQAQLFKGAFEEGTGLYESEEDDEEDKVVVKSSTAMKLWEVFLQWVRSLASLMFPSWLFGQHPQEKQL